ncbi:MAG: hypothetical protein IPP91_11085 [Betaproteobacteria bacterium]|nr:hypothetical protein [Betaproteobacteria bacterium]
MARELIAMMRNGGGVTLSPSSCALLADLAEEGLGSLRALVDSECLWEGDGWWDTSETIDGTGGTVPNDDYFTGCIALLDRAGEIERKEGEPHMIRFVEAK